MSSKLDYTVFYQRLFDKSLDSSYEGMLIPDNFEDKTIWNEYTPDENENRVSLLVKTESVRLEEIDPTKILGKENKLFVYNPDTKVKSFILKASATNNPDLYLLFKDIYNTDKSINGFSRWDVESDQWTYISEEAGYLIYDLLVNATGHLTNELIQVMAMNNPPEGLENMEVVGCENLTTTDQNQQEPPPATFSLRVESDKSIQLIDHENMDLTEFYVTKEEVYIIQTGEDGYASQIVMPVTAWQDITSKVNTAITENNVVEEVVQETTPHGTNE